MVLMVPPYMTTSVNLVQISLTPRSFLPGAGGALTIFIGCFQQPDFTCRIISICSKTVIKYMSKVIVLPSLSL